MSDEIELPEPMAYLNTDCIGERYLHFSAPTGGVTENLYTADQLRAAVEAYRKRRGEPVAWPLASPEDADKGWTLDYRFIEQVERIASQHTDYTTSMEATEQVLIAANEVLRASQPAEQQHGPDYTFTEAMKVCEEGLREWREKPHNKRWWKRIDGTPIQNDLLCCIAEALAAHRKQGSEA